jgi:hypothetical protein
VYGRAQRENSGTSTKHEHRGSDHGSGVARLPRNVVTDGDGHRAPQLELLALSALVLHASAGQGQFLLAHYQASGHFVLAADGLPVARVRVHVELLEGDGDGR